MVPRRLLRSSPLSFAVGFFLANSAMAGWPASPERVEGLLASEERVERERGLALLWAMPDSLARPFVEKALSGEHVEVRLGAARRAEFGRFRLDGALLAPLLESANFEEQEAGLGLVATRLTGDAKARVERALSSPSAEVRRRAVAALVLWGEGDGARNAALLRNVLGDTDDSVRVELVASLGWREDDEASLLIERGLDDASERVRVAAARSLLFRDALQGRAETLLGDRASTVRGVGYEALLRRPGSVGAERALELLVAETEPTLWKRALGRLARYREEGVMREVFGRLSASVPERAFELLAAWSAYDDERSATVARLLAESKVESWPTMLERLSPRRDGRIEGVLLDAHRRGRVGASELAAYFARTGAPSREVVILALEALEEGVSAPESWTKVLARAGALSLAYARVVEGLAGQRRFAREVRLELLRLLVGSERAGALGTPMLGSTEPELRSLGRVLRLSTAGPELWREELAHFAGDETFREELRRALPRLPWVVALRSLDVPMASRRAGFLEPLARRTNLGRGDLTLLEATFGRLNVEERRVFAETVAAAECEVEVPRALLDDVGFRRQVVVRTACVPRLLAFEGDSDERVRALALQRLAQLSLDAEARERAESWWRRETQHRGAVVSLLALLAAAREWGLSVPDDWAEIPRDSVRTFARLARGAFEPGLEGSVLRGESGVWSLVSYPAALLRRAEPPLVRRRLERCEDYAPFERTATHCGFVLDRWREGGTPEIPGAEVIVRSGGGAPLRDQPLVLVDALGRPWVGWSDGRGRVLSPAGAPVMVDSAAAY